MVCQKTVLPRADVGYFEMSKSKRLKLGSFNKEYLNNPLIDTSYIGICHGDSGSGNWFTIRNETFDSFSATQENERSSLVVITTKFSVGIYFRNVDGKPKKENGVCGGNLLLGDGTRNIAYNKGTKITNENILHFIKINIGPDGISIILDFFSTP